MHVENPVRVGACLSSVDCDWSNSPAAVKICGLDSLQSLLCGPCMHVSCVETLQLNSSSPGKSSIDAYKV